MMNQNAQGGQQHNPQIHQHEKQLRSVFVGNIAYDANEPELTTLFSQVGPVVHFRYVHDRETGKPKGYGFCEYVDQQTAESAVRNLNGVEFHGRPLRVDSAVNSAGQQHKAQDAAGVARPVEEGPYGEPVEPAKAPEAISRAVASLPPEQMFDLMKQMKLCIQNNPHEARNMLLQNPQLAYALLQAAVVMRVLDPQVAMSILHRDTALTGPVGVAGALGLVNTSQQQQSPAAAAAPPVMTSQQQHQQQQQPPAPFTDPRQQAQQQATAPMMPASSAAPPPFQMPPQHQQHQQLPMGMQRQMQPPAMPQTSAPPTSSAEEDEKARLIAQVLQLTDEQINMLPADQKQSVLILREQLRSGQH